MSYISPVKAFTKTITTGSTESDVIAIGGGYEKILLGIPTMTSGCDHYIKVSDTEDGTFRRLYHPGYVDTAKPVVMNIDSSVTNCYVPLNFAAEYFKIEVSTAASDTSHTYKVICKA